MVETDVIEEGKRRELASSARCVCSIIRSKGDSFVEREREVKKAIDGLASLSSTQARKRSDIQMCLAQMCTCRYKKNANLQARAKLDTAEMFAEMSVSRRFFAV